MTAAAQPLGAVAMPAASPLFADDLVAPQVAPSNAAGPGFGELMTGGIADINQKLLANEAGLQRLATGDMQNLHQVMIRLEESRLSFQLLMQVRARLLEAYQDVMKMQV